MKPLTASSYRFTALDGWSMPTDHATDQTFCPGCFEPCDDPDVEAFEELDELLCRECAAERLGQPDLFGERE